MSEPDSPETGRPRGMKLAIAGAALLVVAGAATFWFATEQNMRANQGRTSDMVVTVGAKTCDPMDITLPGGKRSFDIVNASDRPIEWEILDGVMVVAERENIAPGFQQVLTVQLQPGEYEITCGLLSNPRGKLTVTPSDEASAAASEVTLRKFLGPLAEYRVYLVMQGNAAIKDAQTLQTAIAAGDLDAARAAWKAAHLPYRRIEPLVSRISDLENAIDPMATYLEGRESDPAFTGYHRIEYGLFHDNSTDGLQPVADRLVSDLQTLSARMKEMQIDPQLLAALPGDMAAQLAEAFVPHGQNLYAGNDLEDLAASTDGIAKLVGLIRPVLVGVDPALDERLAAELDRIHGDLMALQTAEGFAPYATVTEAQRAELARKFTALQATLTEAQGKIGMS
ncbi:iron uptake system protein EfeO [Paracoccus sp. DMF-8]|uniref:iron uptake system protein EfeO n=1 Tax=Paracoccus sp. DMF-8 TaxID=3019445 RepID=UPI0023E8C8A1|nr:iron uptake system protein EfeO [Paracoccus sp. DMF-8]MDF3607032.1 iron uptake system protein EfeO [Paracoccus sp. DMF-8]